MCPKWFVKFPAEYFLLDGQVNQLKLIVIKLRLLTENNQHYTTWEIAILKIPKSIKLSVKMKNVSFMDKTKRTFWPTQ